jgi:hypothetical protein
MSKISGGVWEKSGGVREKCADTVNLFFSVTLKLKWPYVTLI